MFVDKDLQRAFDQLVVRRSFPTGAVVMNPGDSITHVPIVEKGSLRILVQDAEGRERFLYHIMPG